MAHRTAPAAPTAERPPVDISPEVLAILALPALASLYEDQTAGRACVWGGEPLTIETAVDLGEQLTPVPGSSSRTGMRWFPRACRSCIGDRAHTALIVHCPLCALCCDEEKASDCTVGRGLYRIVRECRR